MNGPWMREMSWLVLVTLVAGCSGGGGGSTADVDGGFQVVAEEGRKATVSIRPTGGTIAATSSTGIAYTVTFPAGAVREARTISVTPVSSLRGLTLPGPVLAAVRLEPDGLALAAPVTLDISGVPAGPAIGFHAASDGKQLELQALEASGGTRQLVLHHFSPAGVAQGSLWSATACAATTANQARFDAAWAAAAAGGANPTSVATQRLALLEDYVAACLVGEGQLFTFVALGERAFGVLAQWYDAAPGGVADNLAIARASPGTLHQGALGTFHAWLDTQRPPGITDFLQQDQELALSDRSLAGATTVLRTIEAGVQGANTRCDDVEALDWIDLASELEIGPYADYQNALGDPGVLGVEGLLAIKTCGIRQLALRPDSRHLAVDEEFGFALTALDGAGAEIALPPRPPRWDLVGDAAIHLGDGLVRGAREGTARLEADLVTTVGTILYSSEAQVMVEGASVMDVQPAALTLRAGESSTLTATIAGPSGQPLACPDLDWYSADTSIAEVHHLGDDTAVVTGVAAGQVHVTAVCGEALGAALVTVYDRLTLEPTRGCIQVGESLPLAALASGLPVTDSVSWASSSGAVTVSGGLVTGLAEGRAVVTATLPGGLEPLRASAVMDVTAVPICGTWDFTVEEHGTSPEAYVDRYARVVNILPGTTAGTYIADWGSGAIGLNVSGTVLSGSSIYPWDIYFICEDWLGTAGPGGTMEATSTWTWHATASCGAAVQQRGYSSYWATRR